MPLSEARNSISLSSLKAGGFLASESKHIGTITEMQKELLDTFEQFNRAQLAHVKREMDLASEFVGKVTAARSVPDVMGIKIGFQSTLHSSRSTAESCSKRAKGSSTQR
jgi:Phasin protein